MTGEAFDSSLTYTQNIKNGQRLCKLINGIKPGTIKKIETSSLGFKQMENIGYFIKSCRAFGLVEHDLFNTVDLFEEKDLGSVNKTVAALSRVIKTTVPTFEGPYIDLYTLSGRGF